MAQRFAYTDYAAAATPTSSGDATGYPASNALTNYRWKRWRSTTTNGNQNLDLDFGGSKTLTYVALVDVTPHPGGTVKAQYWTGAAWSDLGTFAFSAITGVGILWVNQATTKLRILFTNTGAVNSFVEIGVVRCGPYYQPVRLISPGGGMKMVDPSEITFSVDRQEFTQRRGQYYQFTGLFEANSVAERDNFITMYRAVGLFQPFFFAFDDSNMNRCLWGRFDDILEATHIKSSYWTIPVSMVEVR